MTYTLGIAYIQARLKTEGIRSVLLSEADHTLSEFVRAVKRHNPMVMGISIYDPTYYLARMMARAVKQAVPGIIVVAGGPTATFSDRLILTDIPWIDYCVRGEGEETFLELYRAIESGAETSKIEGLGYRDGGEIVRTPDRPLITSGIKGAELDILPSPFGEGLIKGDEAYAGIQSARGCAYRCIFCNGPGMFKNKVRYHSNERVVEELRIIHNAMTGTMRKERKVSLWDDNFCLDLKRTKDLVADIINAGLGLRLYCELRADRVDLELMEMLAEANFVHVNFGLESAVPRVLRIIKKLNPVGEKKSDLTEEEFTEKVRENIEAAHRLGLSPTVSFISGLPGETPEEGRRTVDFVNTLPVHGAYHNRLVVFPGTELFDTYKDYGLKVDTGSDPLPCRVVMPYDPGMVPGAPMSSEFQEIYRNERYILDVVFGWWGELTVGKLSRPPLIVLWDRYGLSDEEADWLCNNTRMTAPTFIVFDRSGNHNRQYLELRGRLIPSAPTRSFYLVIRQKTPNPDLRRYRMITNPDFRKSCTLSNSFLIAPLKDYKKIRRDHGPGHTRRYPHFIFGIEDREDMAVWEGFLSEKNPDWNETGLGKLTGLNAVILDGCRWKGRRCPASTLEKFHIMANGEIIPCANGGVIGKAGEPIGDIKNRVKKMFEEEAEKRGCHDCPEIRSCSQCLFPHPLSAGEYCDFRRRHRKLSMQISQMDFLKDYDLKKQMNIVTYMR
ncbi:MAG: radical SAM protein [Chloroflexi bacterium]|nr:radical SAM protein [Chloroflexota bacterium]